MTSVARSLCSSSKATRPASSWSARGCCRVVASAVRRDAPVSADAASSSSSVGRRAMLALVTGSALALQGGVARANILEDIARPVLRPDVDVQDAVVALMDAKSTLKEIQVLAATPADSEERFRARAVWPSYAKRLRAVAEAAPVVAGLVVGGDKEATLSEMYGGTGSGSGAITDAVYMGLGRVLTISGRTIRPEAQASPDPAKAAEEALESFLGKVPREILTAATDFRVARAKAAGLL